MAETNDREINSDPVDAEIAHSSILVQNELQFAPGKFFAELNQMAKTLDSEVSHLETNVGRQVSRMLSSHQDGEFAAPIADDIHDELQDLNRFVLPNFI